MTDDSPYEKLLGRSATPKEVARLHHVKEALGLRDNDALWLVIYALQFYEGLYQQFPKAIGAEASKILAETRATADAAIKTSAGAAKADLARAVAIAARDVAQDVARRNMLQWLVVGMVVGAGLLLSGIFLGQRFGK